MNRGLPPVVRSSLREKMTDLDKLYEKADKYLQRQKFEPAIETYQEILRYDPNDEEALVNLGDLSTKLNRLNDALRYQIRLADFYINRSDVPKAIATCRKVLKLSPRDATILMKLAILLEKGQKNNEALEAYREALPHFRKAGASAQVFDCLMHVVKLDRNNLEEHLELAELAARLQHSKEVMPVLLSAAQIARQAGDESRWEKLIDHAHRLDPADEIATIATTELNLKRGNFAQALELIEPILARKPDDLNVLELASKSLLGAGKYLQAQPLCWKLCRARPERVDLVLSLSEGLIQTGAADEVLKTLDELKRRLFQQGKRNEFLHIAEKIYESDESNLEFLENLNQLYDEMNKDDGLRRSLSRLFDLYLAAENYTKAGEALERLLDVDPYGEGQIDRLVNLEGHIDSIWYQNIQARLHPASSGRVPPAASAITAAEKAETLEDLLVEGEMYHQYQLSAKLAETVEKIGRLFPGEVDKNQRVRELFDAAEYAPKFTASPVPAPAPVGGAAAAPAPGEGSFQSLDDLRKISEITASIYREATPQGVLHVAVNEVGRTMKASRCWGAIGVPDRPPVLTAEYCSPSATPSDPTAAMKVFEFLMGQAGSSPDGWSVDYAAQAPLLVTVNSEIQTLGIRSLQALPLIDRDVGVGLLIVEQCDAPRFWSQAEMLLLRAIATQVVIAINSTRLRRLVRSLAGSDPETGLLPRSAYLECLLSESRRSKDQDQPLSVCLLEPENPRALMKAWGEAGVQRFVQQIGKTLTSVLRQNDIAIRYSPLSIALLFPDTALPQAGLAVEKLRRGMAQVSLDGAEASHLCAAVCEVPLGPNFDAVDGVTEVINRLESSLDHARKEGGKRLLISKFFG